MTWWTENKLKLALLPALIFWVVSGICFVFGLSFENPIGVSLAGLDLMIWVAIGLSIANTVIQIIGNDQDDISTVLFVGWMASYALGIGSNVNTLLSVLHVDSVFLEWTICIALGAMIEVLPEKLLVIFLKSIENKSRFIQKPHRKTEYRPNFPQNKPVNTSRPTSVPPPSTSTNEPTYRPIYTTRPTPKPFPSSLPRNEPTYHPIGNNSEQPFDPERYDNEEE